MSKRIAVVSASSLLALQAGLQPALATPASPTQAPSAPASPSPTSSPTQAPTQVTAPSVGVARVWEEQDPAKPGSKVEKREQGVRYNEVLWYTSKSGTAELSIQGTAGKEIGDIKVLVDGKEVFKSTVKESTKQVEFALTGKEQTVSLLWDNKEIYSETLAVDSEAPTGARATFSTAPVSTGTGTTLVEPGTRVGLSGLTDDDGDGDTKDSGIAEVVLEWLDEGSNNWQPQGTADENGEWLLKESGSYRFRAKDNVGNESIFNLWDISDSNKDIKIQSAEDSSITFDVISSGGQHAGQWYTAPVSLVAQVKAPSGLVGIEATVNGQAVSTDKLEFLSKDYFTNIDLQGVPEPEDGIYRVELVAQGIFGYRNTEVYEVRVDTDDPSISGVSISTQGFVEDDKVYLPENATISWNAVDKHSGVAKVELLYTNAEGLAVVSDVTGESEATFNTGTGYRLRVVDNVGKVTEKTFTELGLPSNDFIVDTSAPRVSLVESPDADYVTGSDNWYRQAGEYVWSVEDENLSAVKVLVNGVEHKATLSNGQVALDLSGYLAGDGRYEVVIEATDKAGNTTTDSFVAHIDSTAPSILGIALGGAVIDRGYGKFSTTEITITPSGDDTGSGVSRFEVLDEAGNVLATITPGTAVHIPTNAQTIRAIDNVGNVSEVLTISSLTGYGVGGFYVDNTSPHASINVVAGQYGDWYRGDVDFTVDFSDNLSLYTGYVTINGQRVSSFTEDSINTDRSLSVSTSGVESLEDGSYHIVAHVTDSAGNTFEVTKVLYKDNTAPEVTDFVFTDLTYAEGQGIAVDDTYGFYSQGATSVRVYAVDGGRGSSGLSHITYTLRNDDGSLHSEGIVDAESGSALVQIPSGFKGYISATATDRVGNVSESRKPSGVITEDRNWHINSSGISISTPETGNTTGEGTALYNRGIVASVEVQEGVSGLRSIEWGVGDNTLGTANIDSRGGVSNGALSVTRQGKGLVYGVRGDIALDSEGNNQRVWVRATDKAGHQSNAERVVAIDKTAPHVEVTYDTTKESGFYNTDRVAKVRVTDANFSESGVEYTGTQGTAGGWVQVGESTWETSIVFNQEKVFDWGLVVTDRAGNKSTAYNSGSFTIDKSSPKVDVTYSDNNAINGHYYNTDRRAKVTVADISFDPSRVEYKGNGKLGSWSEVQQGVWESSVTWAEDGEREFELSVSDRAGNASTPYNSGKFIVDTTKPAIKVDGVKNGTSYRNTVDFLISTDDNNIDLSKSRVSLKGRKGGDVTLTGNLTSRGGGFTFNSMTEDRKWDDLYVAEATIVDMAGNQSTETITFSVNRYGSTFNFLHEDFKGKFFQELPEDVELTQKTVDRMAKDKFQVVVLKDGSPIRVPQDMVRVLEEGGERSDWSYKFDISKSLFNGNDGIYQVQLHAESEGGVKESTLQQEYTFGIDSTAPEVIVSGVEDYGSYNGVSRDVSVEVRDLSGPETVDILLNGKKVYYKVEEGIYHFQVPASSDRQSVEVAVVDKAGNKTVKSTSDFFLSANVFETVTNSKYFLALVGGLLVFLGWVVAYFYKKRRDDEKEEEALQEMRENALKSSSLATSSSRSTGSGSAGGSTGGSRDVLEGVSTVKRVVGVAPSVLAGVVALEDIEDKAQGTASDATEVYTDEVTTQGTAVDETEVYQGETGAFDETEVYTEEAPTQGTAVDETEVYQED